jgi:putative glutamine amidotransferase
VNRIAQAIVLVPACSRDIDAHPYYAVGKKYIQAVRLANCVPLVVPFMQEADFDDLLGLAHGVMLTGSPSNVHPSHFDEDVHDPSLPLDPERDNWTLPLVPRVLALGMPLLAICRGFQEANVALGGSLHQAVQEQSGMQDHRAPKHGAEDEMYGPAHAVHVQAGGVLHRILATEQIEVNSLHGQGIKRLAHGLRVEALAHDGLVEAFSVDQARGFNLGVQWHPEWRAQDNPVSLAIFKAFGQACRDYRDQQLEETRDPDT